MTVDDWVYEAVETHGRAGATLREVQLYIDEHHLEELAVDTIESSLEQLYQNARLERDVTRWRIARRTSKEEALKKLFGDS